MTNCGTTVAAQNSKGAARLDPEICIAWDPGTSPECPAVEEIAAAVHDTLGHRSSSRATSPGTCATRVTGAFRPDRAGGWSAELHFTGQTGESLGDRFLEIRDAPCSALTEPLALVIALMAEGKSSDSTALRVPNPPSPRSEAASRHMTAISIGGAISSGLTADVGLGASLGVASRALAGLPLRLGTTFWFPTTRANPPPTGEFWAWLGAAGFCPSLIEWKQVAVFACARLVAGVVRGVGRGFDENAASVRPLAAGAVGAQVALRLTRQVAIYLGVGAAAPWLRARFVYRDASGAPVPVHEPGFLIPLAEVGIELGPSQGPRWARASRVSERVGDRVGDR
jgi:hypothetical protein